jgi:uncharacterized membrane protein
MKILQPPVSCLSGPKLGHFHTDPLQLITRHTHDMHYRCFKILLPSPILLSEYKSQDIRKPGNTTTSSCHCQHKTRLKRRAILKLKVPVRHFKVRLLLHFVRYLKQL